MRLSFRIKLLIAIFTLSAGGAAASTLFFYNQVAGRVMEQMDNRLKDLGRLGQYMLTAEDRESIETLARDVADAAGAPRADFLASLADGDAEQTLSAEQVQQFEARPDFQRLIQVLRAIKKSTRDKVIVPQYLPQEHLDQNDTPQIRYAYIVVQIPESPDRNFVRFIADGDNERIDMNRDGEISDDEEPTQIGQVYNIASQENLKRAFNGGVETSRGFEPDQWGVWYSSYTPIYDAKGERVIAVLGIDLNAYGPASALNRIKQISFLIVGAATLISLLAGYAITRWLADPITRITDAAERVARRDFSVEVRVNSQDEIGRLAGAFNMMVRDIRDYSQNLEQMVEQRTHELQEALEKVQRLKSQQDADYFLTTLLTSPLFKNWNKSSSVVTDFHIEQIKQFQFKHVRGALGGDLCVSGNLNFNGARWTMFLNADAMGKSMQGAGGALVMGTVINSIMNRSAANKRVLTISPQEWLERAYTELQQVFQTFDGSMFVSCILGLIEDATGRMVYFNAEHPFSVLYRDGKASYIEETVNFRKIGMPFEAAFNCHEFQLQPGDLILVGSDGKDDLRIGGTEAVRVMNEDEGLFLMAVERGEGDMERIRAVLNEMGEITDDLSMIRIGYYGPDANLQPERRVDLGRIVEQVRAKEYADALASLESLPPEEEGFLALYYRGFCLSRLGRHAEAARVLEQARRYDQEQAAMFHLLGKVYAELGRLEEAETYLSEALALKPDHAATQAALRAVRSRIGK